MKQQITQTTKPKNKGGRPPKIPKTQFMRVTRAYLESCKGKTGNYELRPLKAELANLLGIDKDTLTNYGKRSQFMGIIKELEQASETVLNRRLDNSASNQNAMFALKALHGYVEQQHIKQDITSNGETLGVVQLPSNPDNKRA